MFKKRKIAKSSNQSSFRDKRQENDKEKLDSYASESIKSDTNESQNDNSKTNESQPTIPKTTEDVLNDNDTDGTIVYKSTSLNSKPKSKFTFSSTSNKPSVDMTLPSTIYSSNAVIDNNNENSNNSKNSDPSNKPPVAKFSAPSSSSSRAQKKQGISNKPAPASIKVTTMMDYAPDICKDYKQNGYCGFGDTCKFLHIREDYAAGWKLDKDWDEQQIKNRETKFDEKFGSNAGDNSTNEEEEKNKVEEGKCPICTQDLVSPVITKDCAHIFCESCFLKEFKTKKVCKVCNISLSGIVNVYKKGMKVVSMEKKKNSDDNGNENGSASGKWGSIGFKRKDVPV